MNASSVESRFMSCKNIINGTAYKLQKKYGGNLDDLICDGNYYFMLACERYDNTRTDIKGEQVTFEKYLKFNLWNNLLQGIKKKAVRNAILKRVEITEDDVIERKSLLNSLLFDLSTDANQIIQYIVNAGIDYFGSKLRKKKYVIYITKHFLQMGWDIARILKGYKEITTALIRY